MRFALLAAALLGAVAAPASADSPEQLFNNNCAICHQVGGKGVPGQFPRLAGRVGTIAARPEGRAFLTTLVLSGMSGTIAVDGKTIVGIMPDFSSFSDDDLAAILTYVEGLGGAGGAPFTAADMKAARARPIPQPGGMAAMRNALKAAKVIP